MTHVRVRGRSVRTDGRWLMSQIPSGMPMMLMSASQASTTATADAHHPMKSHQTNRSRPFTNGLHPHATTRFLPADAFRANLRHAPRGIPFWCKLCSLEGAAPVRAQHRDEINEGGNRPGSRVSRLIGV